MSIKRKGQGVRHPALFLLLSTVFVLISGGVAWLWQIQQEQRTRADGDSIIGSPSLPAATVDAIFARVGSPMVGTGHVVEQVSRQTNVDDAFALAVWWTETNDGAAGVGRGDRNPGGVRSSSGYARDGGGYTIYPSYAAAITDWFNIIKTNYVSHNQTSVYTLCHIYVGTSGADQWAVKVMNLILRYRGEAPTPVPTIAPSPTPILGGVAQTSEILPTRVVVSTTRSSAPSTPSLPTIPIQTPVAILGLLAACMLVLWGVRTRRRAPVPAVAHYSDPITPLPPLYINEFSPALEHYSPELATLTTASVEVEQLAFSGAPLSSVSQTEQLAFPSMPKIMPVAYSRETDALCMQPTQIPSLFRMRGEPAPLTSDSQVEEIAMPAYAPLSLPRRPLASSSVRSGGGLLKRYSSERE